MSISDEQKIEKHKNCNWLQPLHIITLLLASMALFLSYIYRRCYWDV